LWCRVSRVVLGNLCLVSCWVTCVVSLCNVFVCRVLLLYCVNLGMYSLHYCTIYIVTYYILLLHVCTCVYCTYCIYLCCLLYLVIFPWFSEQPCGQYYIIVYHIYRLCRVKTLPHMSKTVSRSIRSKRVAWMLLSGAVVLSSRAVFMSSTPKLTLISPQTPI